MNRYICQERLLGKQEQQRISNSIVVIIGVGALGSVASELLCRAGVHKIIIFDGDKVDETNLHRQTLYLEEDVGKSKVETAKRLLKKINHNVLVDARNQYFKEDNINEEFDLLLDCTDNIDSRNKINDFCKKNGKPWIHAAVAGTKGQILFVDDHERFDKLWPKTGSLDDCESTGILGPVSSVAASIQAQIALDFLSKHEKPKGMIRFDLANMDFNVYQ